MKSNNFRKTNNGRAAQDGGGRGGGGRAAGSAVGRGGFGGGAGGAGGAGTSAGGAGAKGKNDGGGSSLAPDYFKDIERCKRFLQFFKTQPQDEKEKPVAKYAELLRQVAQREQTVIDVELDDIVQFDSGDRHFVDRIETNTLRYITLFSEAIDSIIGVEAAKNTNLMIDDGDDVVDVINMHRTQRLAEVQRQNQTLDANSILLQNENGENGTQDETGTTQLPKALSRRYELHLVPRSSRKLKLREIKAKHIGSLVTVKAIVTRVSEVKPMIVVATYTCQSCGYEIYQEVGSRQFTPLVTCVSDFCRQNQNPGSLTLQTRASKFIKFQEVKLQEIAEEVPVGHTPRTLTVHCRGELTRRCAPGDLATISGIFLPAPFASTKRGGRARGGGAGGTLLSDTLIEAVNVIQHKKTYASYTLTPELIERVEDFSNQTDVYSKLARSIAPEIFGHDDVKKALLLLMVGGVTRKLPDGMRIRGDINVCLVGDPGVAKSQLLKHIATISPRGVYTSGKGSSGVGLTAAIVRDGVTGEVTLEGGSLVLADMGVCCIDEFDKMEEADRTAIHEVMEQQTVSIAKAGIATTLNARTAILAAANPAYGRYHPGKTPAENINLPAALLSRFDLLFVLLDKPDYEADLALAHHVAHVHRFGAPPVPEFRPVEPEFMRAYISRARRIEPFVPRDLTEYVVVAYVNMRAEEARTEDPNSYTTARTLLGILRLSQGLARLRMSSQVTRADVDEAMRLMHMSKASVEEQKGKKQGVDPMSAIYFIIRDLSVSTSSPSVSYDDVERRVIAKGLTTHQLNECLTKYEDLNVWQLSVDRRTIKFV